MGIIYKITSPSNRVYIGQSIDFCSRLSKYRTLACKGQSRLYRSFLKYGFDSHEIKIIHELPKDCSRVTLDDYEIFYIKQYRDCGVEMLNLNGGGKNTSPSLETRQKLSDFNKGKPKPESQKIKMSLAQIGKKIPEHIVKKCVQKRRENGNYNFSDEHKRKIKEASIGRVYKKRPPMTDEHKRKISVAVKNYCNRRAENGNR